MSSDLAELEDYLRGALSARNVALESRALEAVAEVVHALTTRLQAAQIGLLNPGRFRAGHGFGRRASARASSRSFAVDAALRDFLADLPGAQGIDERLDAVHGALRRAGIFLGPDSVRQCALATSSFVETSYLRDSASAGGPRGSAAFAAALYGAVIGFHQGTVCFTDGELPPLHPALATFVEGLLAQRPVPDDLPARDFAHRALDATIETWDRVSRGRACGQRLVSPALAELYRELLQLRERFAAEEDPGESAALHAICHARRVARELGADARYLEIEAQS